MKPVSWCWLVCLPAQGVEISRKETPGEFIEFIELVIVKRSREMNVGE